MTEFRVTGFLMQLAPQVESILGPKKYHLHSRIGNEDWYVRVDPCRGSEHCFVGVRDPEIATWLALRLL